MGKKKYLNEELGEGTVNLMKLVKRAIDPLGLFNPGKVGIFLLRLLSILKYLFISAISRPTLEEEK
jgi:hypothetical protein